MKLDISEQEKELLRKAMKAKEPPTYYHGGNAGLKVFGFIQPPSVTGSWTTANMRGGEVCKRDRVYVTTSFEAAAMFASVHGIPTVYTVQPIGDLEQDEDCSKDGLSFACKRARIVSKWKLDREAIDNCRKVLFGFGGL